VLNQSHPPSNSFTYSIDYGTAIYNFRYVPGAAILQIPLCSTVLMPPKKRMPQDFPSQQEKKAVQLTLLKQQVSIEHCQHVLNVLRDCPQLWPKHEFKQIRELVLFTRANVSIFSSIAGDNLPDACANALLEESHRTTPSLTKNYVSRLAKYQSVIDNPSPIFQVVSTQKKFEVSAALQAGKNSIHFTHIRILDGSGDGMVCRLNMNLAHDGSKLCAGDIVQLHMFTPLTYVTSSGGEVNVHQCHAPMVVIHTFSKIGYRVPPRSITDLMICIDLKQSYGNGMHDSGAMATAAILANGNGF
jgi:hypothetical protein